jgi:hypothetical protein
MDVEALLEHYDEGAELGRLSGAGVEFLATARLELAEGRVSSARDWLKFASREVLPELEPAPCRCCGRLCEPPPLDDGPLCSSCSSVGTRPLALDDPRQPWAVQ